MYAVVFSEEGVSVHKLGYEDDVWWISGVLLCLHHRWVDEWEILPWLGWLVDHTKCVREFLWEDHRHAELLLCRAVLLC